MSEDSRGSSFGRRMDRLMSYIAIFVAIIAALAALQEARSNREHQAISVWPYVQSFAGVNFGEPTEQFPDRFAFLVTNKGVGPAIIEDLTIARNGQTYQSWSTLLYRLAEEKQVEGPLAISESAMEAGEVLEAGELRWIARTNNLDLARHAAQLVYGTEEVTFELCYCSLYRECWRLTFPDARPEDVAACFPD